MKPARKFTTLALTLTLAFVSSSSFSRPPHRVQISILGTTDLHGNILPTDYYTNKPDNRGLAKIATLIKRIRRQNADTILIDSGDIIQGTPLETYHNKKNNNPPDPMM